ncbi:epididymal secretory protein 4-like [Anolis sagrei]|uniref:epididymal secretory protein 4-like n=1 Tax=Anolis sagrei TaxID=38937 RepID=UPI003522889D
MKQGFGLALALCCLGSIGAFLDIPVQQDFFWKKLVGKWYPGAMAKQYPLERTMYAYTTQPLSNGDLVLKIDIPRDGDCRRKRLVLYALKLAIFETEDGKITFYFVETDYETYHIVYVEMEDEHFLHLYTKEEAPPEEAKERFLALAQNLNFQSDRIYYANQMGLCTSPPEDV